MTAERNFSEKLFGREVESNQIKKLAAQAGNGKPCLALVSGPSGVGKTVLVKKTLNSLSHEKMIFIYSKLDEYNPHNPYYPFVQLMGELIRYMLAAPKSEVEANKKKIEKAVGNSIGVLSCLIPELEHASGKESNAVQINLNGQRRRIEHAFFQITKEFAKKDSPIVMFIDDLQWADELSLSLLEYFCCNLDCEYLMIICAFKDCPRMDMLLEKIESIDNRSFCLEHISVNNFTFSQTFDYVLHCSKKESSNNTGINEINKIATILYKNTLGNPFGISQMKEVFKNNMGKPDFDYASLIPYDIVQAIADKISRLPEKTKNALIYASLIGSTFSLDILSQILQSTNDDVLPLLDTAFLTGMIVPAESCNQFEFTHDRFREELIRISDKPERLHLTIGRELLQIYQGRLNGNTLTEIMHHFIVSAELIKDKAEKIKLAGYFSIAGNAFLRASAYADALQYFKMAIRFIEDVQSDIPYSVKYNSYLGYANAMFLNEKYSQAEEAFRTALAVAKNDMDIAKVLQCKTVLYFSVGNNEMTIATGLEALAKLGIYIPANPSRARTVFEMAKSMCEIRVKCINEYLRRKNQQNSTVQTEILLINILNSLSLSAIVCNPELFKISLLLIGQIAIKAGNMKYASLGYTIYGVMVGSVFYHYKKERDLRDLSSELASEYGKCNCTYYTDYINMIFVKYWLDDWHTNIASFDMLYEAGEKNGEQILCACSLPLKLNFMFCTGTNLDALITDSHEAYIQAGKLKAKSYALYLLCMTKAYKAIKLLSIRTLDEEKITRQFMNKNHVLVYYLTKMQIHFLREEYQEAAKLVTGRNKYEEVLTEVCQYADLVFYQSLIITSSGNFRKIKYRNILHKNVNKLRKWFESCPANFGHKYYLVSAEIARMKGESGKAADLYEKAVLSAAENGFTQNEAIASELSAKFFFALGNWQKAETCIATAYDKYKQWGAEGKISLLEQKYPFIIAKREEARSDIPEKEESNWDGKIAEALKIIVQEKDSNKLLERIMDITLDIGFSNRGCLLYEKNDELYILLIRSNHHSLFASDNTALPEFENLPQKMIYYTFNTYKTVILRHDQEKGVFSNDPYISKHSMQSQLCIPLILRGVLLGVLYLEKDPDVHEYSAKCIEAITALSSQAMLLEKLQVSVNDGDINKDYSTDAVIEELTPREREILCRIASGDSNKEIANGLNLSVNTVKTHILSIFGKLNVNRRSQAALKARDLNLIERKK